MLFFFFFQAEDGIRDVAVTGVQTCALPISCGGPVGMAMSPCSRAKSPKACPAPWSAAVRQRSGVELERHAVVWLPNLPTAVFSLPNAAVVSLSATVGLTVLLLALLATTT